LVDSIDKCLFPTDTNQKSPPKLSKAPETPFLPLPEKKRVGVKGAKQRMEKKNCEPIVSKLVSKILIFKN
jgi:hypothetical protein